MMSPQAEQRTPVAALARFIPAHEAAIEAPGIAALPFEVVASAPKIEPDHAIAGAMPLSLGFIAERRQRQRSRLLRAAKQEDRGAGPDAQPGRLTVSASVRLFSQFEVHSLPLGMIRVALKTIAHIVRASLARHLRTTNLAPRMANMRLAQDDSNPKAIAAVDSIPAVTTTTLKAISPSANSSQRCSQLRTPAGWLTPRTRRNLSLGYPMTAILDRGGMERPVQLVPSSQDHVRRLD
ncbi:hypothetical protein M2221_003725 [Bradyrhizobium elkanii]|nr:hypothetical protein [Bradyrhizobium elkanii]